MNVGLMAKARRYDMVCEAQAVAVERHGAGSADIVDSEEDLGSEEHGQQGWSAADDGRAGGLPGEPVS